MGIGSKSWTGALVMAVACGGGGGSTGTEGSTAASSTTTTATTTTGTGSTTTGPPTTGTGASSTSSMTTSTSTSTTGSSGSVTTGGTSETDDPGVGLVEVALYQLDFDKDIGEFVDTPWGELEITYTGAPNVPVLFLNLSFAGEWALRNVPVRSGGPAGEEYTLSIAFDLGVDEGTPVVEVMPHGVTLTEQPVGAPPEEDRQAAPMDRGVRIRSGFEGQFTTYVTVDSPLWFYFENYTERAFHPWDKIVNQDCGLYECFAVGVSNSLKLLKALHPDEMAMVDDADISVASVRQHTGWKPAIELMGETIPGGSPGGLVDDPMTCWQRKKTWCEGDPDLPISTEIINDKDQLHRILEGIKDGCDVEIVTHFHAVMVTGVIIRADGRYVFEVVDDSKQGEAGGTRTTLIEYDPTANRFGGQEWVEGESFQEPMEQDRPLFMIECVM